MRRTNLKIQRRRLWTIASIVFAMTFVTMVTMVTGAQQFDMQPGAAITEIKPGPVIRVNAVRDPAIYDTIDASDSARDLVFNVKIRGSCPESYRLSGVTASIFSEKVRQSRKTKIGFNPDHRSIGPEHGAKWDFTVLSFPYLEPSISPATTCNQELARRSGLGESRTELLRKGFDVDVPGAYEGYLSVTCHKAKPGFYEDPDYGAKSRLPVTIRCMPTGYKPPRTKVEPQRTAVPDPPIESLAVVAEPSETQGRQCPVSVTFRGKITPGQETTYTTFNTKYRFVGENNFSTDWLPVSVRRGETKTVIWRRSINAPENDRAGSFKTPGGRVKIPVYRGWMLLEIMLPNGTKRSERTAFSVDCNVQSTIRAK
ncbi:MAG TPA: hypothetical protein VF251_04745 [Pyrinomonadaceae bacterium]